MSRSNQQPGDNTQPQQQLFASQAHQKGSLQPLGSILERYSIEDKGGHITREFQDYAYRLAVDLNDLDHKSLYMRMAKTIDRSILDDARSFVLDARANSRAKLFMWKVTQLRKEQKEKKK